MVNEVGTKPRLKWFPSVFIRDIRGLANPDRPPFEGCFLVPAGRPCRTAGSSSPPFVFGLIHGFGFANVLAEVGLNSKNFVLSLVGFNCGVELGQLAIVGLFIPVAFLSRNSGIYQKSALIGGSAFIAAISMIWRAERIFGVAVFT